MKKLIFLLALIGIGLFINAPVLKGLDRDVGYKTGQPFCGSVLSVAEIQAPINIEVTAPVMWLHPDPGEAVITAERTTVLTAPLSGYLNTTKEYNADTVTRIGGLRPDNVTSKVFSTNNGGLGY